MEVKLLSDASLVPEYQKFGSAGFDLHARIPDGTMVIEAGKHAVIGTGIAVAVPFGYELQIRPRSGLALKHGITVLNSPGTVDHGFKNEVGVILINHGENDFIVHDGDRIAQALIKEIIIAKIVVVDELTGYDRGGGFGSTNI
ncbi:dUTP diphosphatase [Thermoactinomyces daqus]|uniref:dUTP diphosphatase n=1 Tax=Thermoactinomyces daqus TaxID=1329516 RepID=A0A7W1XA44_9BACL|nr:dUTP diphosphatase [Thermoactinomyces daqus]